MNWIHHVLPYVGAHAVRFLMVAFAFSLPAIGFPAIQSQRILRRGFFTDVLYYFLIPVYVVTVDNRLRLLVMAGIYSAFPRLHGGSFSIAALASWLQILILLITFDMPGYWLHRWMHTNPILWRFHAVHHSSRELDWLSGLRFHPVNTTLSDISPIVIVLLLRPSPAAFAAVSLIGWLVAMFEHVNVNWTFGPLRYLVTTPVFHRWHHTHSHEGGNRNFAGTFPILDLVFGTFYIPKSRYPERFGTDDDDIPEGFIDQMVYPFGSVRQPAANDEAQPQSAQAASGS